MPHSVRLFGSLLKTQSSIVAAAFLVLWTVVGNPNVAEAANEAKAIDPSTCNKGANKKLDVIDVEVPGVPYGFQLSAPKDQHGVALSTCAWIGAPALTSDSKLKKAFDFTLYDLNGEKLVNGDKVVIKGPHGRLVGLKKSGDLMASRKYYATNEVFTIKLAEGGKILAVQAKIALQASNGKFITAQDGGGTRIAATADKIEENETFTIVKLKAPLTKKLKDSYAKAQGPVSIVSGGAFGALSGKPINQIFGKKAVVKVTPKACSGELDKLVIVPEEPEDADLPGFAKAEKTSVAKKGKKLMAKVWGAIDKSAACGKLKFEVHIPGTDLGIKAFYTRDKDPNRFPVWHVALMAGSETLNNNILTKTFPGLEKAFGGLKIKKLVGIVSLDKGTVKAKDLGDELGKLLGDYQNTVNLAGKFKDSKKKTGSVTLQPGVNIFGEFDGPKSGPLAILSEAALPGSTKSNEPWKISSVMGGSIVKAIVGKVSKFERVEEKKFTDKKDIGIDVWLPGYTPFPFNLINNKKILHAEVKKARLTFSLAKDKKDGKTSQGINASVKSWNNYWVLNDSNPFPIVGEGEISFKNDGVTGSVDGLYEVASNKDPLGFIPGLNLTKLRIGGAISDKKTGKKKKTTDLSVKLASEIKVGGQALQTTLDLIVEKKSGAKAGIKELRISLSGDEKKDGGRIKLAHMGPIGKIPLAKELVLEKGVIGIVPRAEGFPDFYITGGSTWEKTGLGGKMAIMKTTPKGSSKEDLFIFLTVNDFSLAGLLPKEKKFDSARSVLTMMKTPKTMLMFNTLKKDAALASADFPAPLKPLFDGFVSGDEGIIPIKGNSLSIVSALSFDEKEKSTIMKGFKQLGVSKFGPDGPLIIAGAIGGLTSGHPSIDIAARLPGFQFPKKIGGKVNPIGEIVHPDGVEFFIDLIVSGEPRVEAGIKGLMTVNLPRLDNYAKKDKQKLTGRMYVKGTALGEVGVMLAADKKGTWTDPMGLNSRIGIKDTAILLGFVTSAAGNLSVDIGLGGSMVFDIEDAKGRRQKLTYDGDLMIGAGVLAYPPYVSPTKFGLNLGAKKISGDTAVRVADAVLDGILTGGMANMIIDGDPNNPLAPGLPNGPVKDGVNKLRKGLAKESLPKLMHLDEIPLPDLILTPPKGKKRVRFYIATPGATIPGREDTMNGLGFSLTGAATFGLLGKKLKLGELDFTMSAAEGFRAYGRTERVKIGALILGHPNGTEFDLKASLEESYLKLKGGVKLTPLLDDQTAVSVTTDSTSFFVKKQLGDVIAMGIDVKTGIAIPPKFTVDALLDNGINKMIETKLLPAFGIPKPVIKKIASLNPLVIESFKLNADLVSFASGDPKKFIGVKIKPKYFGELRPLIDAKIPSINWKHPEQNLLGSQELQGKIFASMIDYMIDHPEKAIKLPNFDIQVLALKNAYFGGGTRDYAYADYAALMKKSKKPAPGKAAWEKLAKKPQEKAFIMKADTTLLDIKQKIDLEITPKNLRFNTKLGLLKGAVEMKVAARSNLVNDKLTNMTFDGEISSGLDTFVTENVMPKLGIPDPVIKILKGAAPIIIRRAAMSGELVSLVTGAKPVTVYLDPIFFGDEAYAKKPGKKTIKVRLPKLDVKKPLNTILAGPEVIAALTKALIVYLVDNPQKIPAIDLGLMKFDESVLGGVDVTGFFEPKKKEKVFQIKGGLSSFLSKPKADMKFGHDYTELKFEDKLLGGVIQSKFTMSGDIKEKSLNMHGAVSADFKSWFKLKGVKSVTKIFDSLNPGFDKARHDLKVAMAEVKKLDKEIVAKRKLVKKDRDKAASPLKAAKAEVAKLKSQITALNKSLKHNKGRIKTCNQTMSACVLSAPKVVGCKKRILGKCVAAKIRMKCIKHATIANLPARGICEAKNTPIRAALVKDAAGLASVVSAKVVAEKTLKSIIDGITDFPIDLDPRVAAPLTARIAATAAVKTAQVAVEGVDLANKLIPLGLKAVSRGDSFVFEKGDFYGRFPQVTQGEPMVFDVKYKMGGKSITDRMAFSSIDAAFNTRQMSVIGLGLAVDTIVTKGKKMKVVPHELLDQVENLYNHEKAEADKDLQKVIALNPLVPALHKKATSMVAAMHAESDHRKKAVAKAIKKEKIAAAKANKAKEVKATKQLAAAKKAEKTKKAEAAKSKKHTKSWTKADMKNRFPNKGLHLVIKASGKCLSGSSRNHKGDQAIQYKCLEHPNQTFKAVYHKNGSFNLINQMSKMCLEVKGSSKKDHAKVIHWKCGKGAGQLWRKVEAKKGYFTIQSEHSKKCLDLTNGNKKDLAPLQQYKCKPTSAAQLFHVK